MRKIVLETVVFVFICFSSALVFGDDPLFWKPVKVIAHSQGSGGVQSPSIATAKMSPDSVMIVYQDTNLVNGVDTWRFKQSPNNGATWEDSILVEPCGANSDGARFTAIAKDNNGIHVLLERDSSCVGTNYVIEYLRSTTGGLSWRDTFSVAHLGSGGMIATDPSISTDPWGVIVVWRKKIAWGGSNVYSRRGTYKLGRIRWEDSVQVDTDEDYGADFPQVLTQYVPSRGWMTFVVYRKSDEWALAFPKCRYSTDFGATWRDTTLPLPSDFDEGSEARPSLAMNSQGTVFVAYALSNPYPLLGLGVDRVLVSQVGGTQPVMLTGDATPFLQQSPRIAIDANDTMYVVWRDNRNDPDRLKFDIYYDRSINGIDWMEYPDNKRVTRDDAQPPTYDAQSPDIATSPCGNRVHFIWRKPDPNTPSTYAEILYRHRSPDTSPPCAPEGLTAGCDPMGSAHLWWNSCSSEDATGYNIYRSPLIGPPVYTKLNSQPLTQPYYMDPTACCDPNVYGYDYYVTQLDCAENESEESNHAQVYRTCLLSPLVSVDLGTENPSRYTIQRSGYYPWGRKPETTVDFGTEKLLYRFEKLNPDSSYILAVGLYEDEKEKGREQSLYIDGVKIHGKSRLISTPVKATYLIPKKTYKDGVIDISFKREKGKNAIASYLWLYSIPKGFGGPQSSEEIEFTRENTFLYPARPNPSTGEVTFSYALPKSGKISLKVYNSIGQVVRELVNGEKKAGVYTVLWDGRDGNGSRVSSGVYFYQLRVGSLIETRRVVILK